MPAPSGIIWGAIASKSDLNQGRIGIKPTVTNLNGGTSRITMEVWYWTKMKTIDSVNNFAVSLNGMYYGDAFSVSINAPSNTAWSTDNQVYVGTWSIDRSRTSNPQIYYFKAYFDTVEYGGGAGDVEVSYTVPSKEKYTIQYNANGGSNAPSNQTKEYGTNITLSSTKPTREGHTFLGWGTSATDTTVDYNSGATYSSNSAITLYAIWKAYTYAVYFDANGGSNAPSGLTKTYGVDLPLPTSVPTRENYNFLGWNTFASATEPLYLAGGKYTNNNAVTLYAVWELAYVKPIIKELKVLRCNVNGVVEEAGTYAKISFEWETERAGSKYAVYYKLETEEAYYGGKQVTLSGNSGKVDAFILDTNGNKKEFSTEYTYDIKLNVADNNGFSPAESVINSLFIPIDWTENMKGVCFGEPATEEDGLLRLAYDKIDLDPKDELLYKGKPFFEKTLLWSGSEVMPETKSITLPKKISETKSGILLVFARGTYNLTTYFVPKEVVLAYTRTTHCFPLCTGMLDYIGSKTLNISDTKIEGHTDNDATGTNAISGITYHNELFYLVRVYEV